MKTTKPYIVVKVTGAWEIHHRATGETMSRFIREADDRVRVGRIYFREEVAQAYARAWNEGRSPSAAELSAALQPAA